MFLCLAQAATLCWAIATEPNSDTGWTEAVNRPDLKILTRAPAAGSGGVKDLCAIGRIAAPNWIVKNVIDDAENYPRFMPYVAEVRVLSRDLAKRTLITYNRLTPPLVSARDYTLRVFDESRRAANGSVVYSLRWELANELGPPPAPGVVRLKVNTGLWLLEPIENGVATRATYSLHTDGGGLPAFIVNTANKRSVSELFIAVRKAAADPKYGQSKPREP